MRKISALLAATLLSVSLQTMAREIVPIVNLTDLPVASASGKPPTADQVKQAIQTAAVERQWILTEVSPGRLLATKQWNNAKHTIMTDVGYTADKFSLTYKDSVNMNYGQRNGAPAIHPHYNRFTREFGESIRLALSRL
jgi:hypothetical protein